MVRAQLAGSPTFEGMPMFSRGLWISIVLLLALTACAQEAKSYAGPQEIVRALEDAGISCTALKVADGTTLGDTEHASLVAQRGVCVVENEEVTITTFRSEQDRDDWLAVGRLLHRTAYGPDWAVTGASDEVVDDIAEALGASTDGK